MRVCSLNDNVIHTIMSRLLPALCSLCRYVLVKYAVRGVAQDGRLSPLFSRLYALCAAIPMLCNILWTLAGRASNEGSRRFHNQGKRPYSGLLLVERAY